MLVNLSSPSGGATITTAQSSGTINNNDAPNSPPVAVSDSGTQGRCSYKTYNVVANDTDADGDYPLTVIAVTGRAVVASSTSVGFTSDTTTAPRASPTPCAIAAEPPLQARSPSTSAGDRRNVPDDVGKIERQ